MPNNSIHNMTDATLPDFETRHCFVILESQFEADRGYIPSLIFENESGHYPMRGRDELSTPWYWGKTFSRATEVCERVNRERFNITPKQAEKILISSMYPKKASA